MTDDNTPQPVRVEEANIEGDDAAARRALAAKFKAAAFGEIVSVLMRSKNHRALTLAEIETFVVPPVLSKQYLVARARPQNDPSDAGMPVGVVLWAKVSDELDRRLSAAAGAVALNPADWTSGEHLWVIDVVAAPAVAQAMIEELKRSVFAGRRAKIRVRREGGIAVETIEGALAA
ncbi:MAG: toxin-activating lysine-acyltransferase [Hyphomicrobiales bacterium]|nr:toxin-activating lysine-acyltransferase [Hyphomicrobiales bacterium]